MQKVVVPHLDVHLSYLLLENRGICVYPLASPVPLHYDKLFYHVALSIKKDAQLIRIEHLFQQLSIIRNLDTSPITNPSHKC